MHRPDEGTILLDGREVHFRSPADAIAAGIGMVHQHFMLADNFTVLENIVLGSEPTEGGRLDRAEARRRIREISDRYALDLDPDVLVEDLGVGDRQRVEIAKVLYRGATHPDPRRADRRAGAAGGRRAVRQPRRAQARGPDRHLHLAQARRGAQGRRLDHRHPPRHHRRRGRPEDDDRPRSSPR